jgi:redox-sensitive bicupin YhaK (pirin superfamily)
MDGAGVSLTRIFGFGDTELTDPFLLLDYFGSENPDDYLAGFPWHPHRGIETVTYMLEGRVGHGDSLGNSGIIGPGDVQWMTAGSGIIHEEMPQKSPHGVRGFQLWVNLPRKDKMRDPAYRGVVAGLVPVCEGPGTRVKVIAGEFGGVEGAVSGIAGDPGYLDIGLEAGASIDLSLPEDHTAIAYVYGGGLSYPCVIDRACLVFGPGDSLSFKAGDSGASLIFFHGLPLREPVAWRGPIVMNSEAELDQAFAEYSAGTFVKDKK